MKDQEAEINSNNKCIKLAAELPRFKEKQRRELHSAKIKLIPPKNKGIYPCRDRSGERKLPQKQLSPPEEVFKFEKETTVERVKNNLRMERERKGGRGF